MPILLSLDESFHGPFVFLCPIFYSSIIFANSSIIENMQIFQKLEHTKYSDSFIKYNKLTKYLFYTIISNGKSPDPIKYTKNADVA